MDDETSPRARSTKGGGVKKVLYTLQTVRRIGLKNSAKALKAKNTCKACGLGMGGQNGGMTNELGEFPSVCNKSVQAQSTDIQPPIPAELFQHPLEELRELTAHELEHAGRLDNPVFKGADESRYREVSWDWAIDRVVERMSQTSPDRGFFYSSGRSSNEAGFVLQLLARLWGTNNVNNCSYYCHQATGVGLGSTIGTGTATVELDDLSGCDLVFVIGANPASNHPRFIHKLIACRERGGQIIVINPARETGLVRFAAPKNAKSMISGGSEIASHYLQPNIGSDLALLKGIAKAILETDTVDDAFVTAHCDDWEAYRDDLVATSWSSITNACGVSQSDIEIVASVYAASERAVFAWGMGITHHRFGCENVEYIANLALMRGMVGRRHAGLLPLRGHSNVQGIGTIGVKPVLPREVFERIESELGVTLPHRKGFDTLAALDAADRGEIDVACMVGGNLFSATPDTTWARQSLDKIPFKLFLTTTLNQGHVYGVDRGEVLILPVAARDEEPQPTTQESMFNYVRLSDGGIRRLGNVRSEVEIISEIGRRLRPGAPIDFGRFGDHETVRETIAKTVPGMEQILDIGVAKREFHVRGRLLHRPEFKTDTGRASFCVHSIPEVASDRAAYPFVLASIRSEGQFNSIIYEERDSYRHDADRESLLMSADDMRMLGLSEGDRVDVISRSGKLRGLKARGYELTPGNVLAYYPEANALVSRQRDPRSQTPHFKSVAVQVRPTRGDRG